MPTFTSSFERLQFEFFTKEEIIQQTLDNVHDVTTYEAEFSQRRMSAEETEPDFIVASKVDDERDIRRDQYTGYAGDEREPVDEIAYFTSEDAYAPDGLISLTQWPSFFSYGKMLEAIDLELLNNIEEDFEESSDGFELAYEGEAFDAFSAFLDPRFEELDQHLKLSIKLQKEPLALERFHLIQYVQYNDEELSSEVEITFNNINEPLDLEIPDELKESE